MCKTRPAECKPLEENGNIQTEEENVPEIMSEDESEDSDTDESYFTDSSADNGVHSDTDAESASGNRVTPEMVVWLMLREQGLITEERYAQRPEQCTDNIKSLIPTIPRSYSWDSIHTRSLGSDFNGSDTDLDEKDDEKVESERGKNDNTVEALNDSEVDKSKVKETVEDADVKENAGGDVYDSDIVMSENEKKQLDEDITEKQADSDVIPEESKKEIESQDFQEQPIIETKQLDEDITVMEQQSDSDVIPEESKKEIIIGTRKEEVNEEIMETIHTQPALSKQNDINPEPQNVVLPSENTIHPSIVNGDSDKELDTVLNRVEGQTEDYNMATEETANVVNENEPEVQTAETTDIGIEDLNNEDMDNSRQDVELTETKNSTEDSEPVESKTENMSIETSGKKTKSFKYILKTLVKEKRIVEEKEEPISDEYGEGFVAVLKTFVGELDYEYDDNEAVHLFNDNNECLKMFALFLNFYSPSSYKYVTETFNTPLPDQKKLCSWYLNNDQKPGLTGQAFKILKEKSSIKRQTCALMFCDVYLKNEGCCWYDQVDYGGGSNDHHMDKAVLVYVFLLVSLDEDWKMPIGYIFARYIPAESQAELIRVCLTQCYDAGVDVVAVTLEKPTPAEFLGCSFQDPKSLKTTFKHPVCDRDVAVWIDPCLAVKSARQTLKVKGELKDNKDGIIRWNLLRRLRRLHAHNTIFYEREEHLKLRNYIAKIGITTETFSTSLVAALWLSDLLLPQHFRDTAPTQKYILYINFLYDILDSEKKKNRDFSETLKSLDHIRRYLLHMFCNEDNGLAMFDEDNLDWGDKKLGYRHFIEGKSACGIIGFLICIESYKHLYSTLVEKEKILNGLNTHRLCKVHAEDFVKNLRAFTYTDPDDYTGERFQEFYEKLFDILMKNPHFTDREVSLERWPLTDRYGPAAIIKLTSGKRAYDDVYSSQYALKKLRKTSRKDKATQLVRQYSKALDIEIDMSVRKKLVGYLAGWIAARFARYLRCETCIDTLCTHKKKWYHEYVTLRRLNRVCLPSKGLFRICWECERVLKLLKQKGSLAKLRCLVMRRLASQFPWQRRRSHHPCHRIQLARLVIAKYIPLRIKAPFSPREKKRLIKMFRLSKSIAKDSGNGDMDEVFDGSVWSEHSDELHGNDIFS